MAQVLRQFDHHVGIPSHAAKPSLFQQLQMAKSKQNPPTHPTLVGLESGISGPAARIRSKVDQSKADDKSADEVHTLKPQIRSSPQRRNVTEVKLEEKLQPMSACQAHMCQRFLAQQNRPFAPAPFAALTQSQNTAEDVYYKDKDWDGEMALCPQCNLPIGDMAYDGTDKPVHGECLAQKMLQDLKQGEAERLEREATLKKARRVEYDIGWKMEHIPPNTSFASKLDLDVDAHDESSMTCLVLDESTHTVRLGKTFEPTAAVNLVYLSLALRVRRDEGREPWFSLDPVAPKEICSEEERMHAMQVKRYEPEWLAGTSVGDVLFQADYHLKELSIGEAEQPVVGMRSCFDYSANDGIEDKWTAREWFMIRKAEVQVSEDHVVIPFVKMGVEAREQVCDADGLHDATITRPDHPMVRYAESFTQNFELIAERKSVFYHLRELAKACVMAKFLVDSNIALDESWYNIAAEPRESDSLEIPQLWNERFCGSKIRLDAGEFKRSSGPSKHGLYGGVAFGVDKFTLALGRLAPRGAGPVLAQPSAPIASRDPVAPIRPREAPARAKPKPQPRVKRAPRERPPGVYLSVAPTETRLAIEEPPEEEEPQGPPPTPMVITTELGKTMFFKPNVLPTKGVDLNLNQFDLSTPSQTQAEAFAGSWSADSIDAGKSFWSHIDGDESLLDEQDAHLLRDIFNPNLSDRRKEGDRFAPPGTAFSHVVKLRNLLKAEEQVRAERIEHFMSSSFIVGDAGPLFPASWTTSLEIESGRVPTKSFSLPLPQGTSLYRVDCNSDMERLLKTTPEFERCTEDGMKFRIYKSGSLEVRTTQEHGKPESIGAVFSIRSSTQAFDKDRNVNDDESIVRVIEYVKFLHENTSNHEHGYYVVTETEQGNSIVTERLQDGKLTWEENPAGLDDRNSLARVIRSVECRIARTRTTIADVKAFRATQQGAITDSRMYAQQIFIKAIGGVAQMIRSNNIKAKTVAIERDAP